MLSTHKLTAAHWSLQTVCWMKFLEILQHLPQLSCCADLIRKPFLAITIINPQETWRFVIRPGIRDGAPYDP